MMDPALSIPLEQRHDGGGSGASATALRDRARWAAGALLLVAVVKAFFGAMALLASGSGSGPHASLFAIPAAFLGLFLWARRNPLPATLAGLVLFVSLDLARVAADPESLADGLLTRIILLVILAKAVVLGVQHRNMERAARLQP